MYPELGHRPIERLGVSNRAYILERSVPYLASALTAGVVGLGPLLASMPGNLRGRRKRNRSYSMSDMYSHTPMPTPMPTFAPTPANISAISSISGDVSVISDPLTKGSTRVALVGSDTDRNYYAKLYLGNTTGWGFRSAGYRRSLLFGNKLTLMAGDIFTTEVADDVKPTHIVGESYETLGSVYNRNFDDALTVVEKVAPTARSALRVKCNYTNMASHFCFPVGIFKQYGSNASGLRQVPYGLDDLFQTFTNISADEQYRYQYPHNETHGSASTKLWGYEPWGVGSSSDWGLYMSMDMDVIIHNPMDYSQTFELYYLTPRKDTNNSPLYDFQNAYMLDWTTNTDNNASTFNMYHPSQNLFRIKGMRDLWRCIKKKKVQVAGKGTLKVTLRVPLSLIQYNKLQSLTDGSERSLKGLTGWLYVKCYGLFGYDSQDFTDGAPTVHSNVAGLAYAPGQYILRGEHRVTVLRQHKNHRPFIDQRAFALEGTDQINITENDENNEVTI